MSENGDYIPNSGIITAGISGTPILCRVQVQMLNELSDVPVAARAGDAGFDLRSVVGWTVPGGERAVIPTGITVAIPDGFAGFILPRSGVAAKSGVTVINSPGLIDSGYRGEVKVALVNHGLWPFVIRRGDRIAQFVILPVPAVEFQVVDALPESERGEGGFGSTGS